MTDLDALKAALERLTAWLDADGQGWGQHEKDLDVVLSALRQPGALEALARGRRVMAGDEALVEAMARAIAREKGVEICSDASYRFSTFGPLARAALAALKEASGDK